MVMLKGAVICPDEELSEKLEQLLADMGVVALVRTLHRYPNAHELTRMLRSSAPQVLFLSIESLSRALEIVHVADEQLPGLQVVAIGQTIDPQSLLEVMRSGVREYLAPPFQRQAVYDALLRIKETLDRRPIRLETTDLLFAFLPSKPGVGTTTIATNLAIAASRLPEEKTLLVDCDLTSGMIRFLLQLHNSFSLLDAAERSFQLDDAIWPQLVTPVGNLDVLHSGRLNPDIRVEPSHLRHIIEFARRNYKMIFFDLSGNLEKFSLEALHEAKKILLVVTPEIPSLHLAREKIQYLRNIDLADKVSILLNRCQRKAVIGPSQVEELLDCQVAMTFSNDYQGVHRAMTEGKAVDPASELGKQFTQLAQRLLEPKRLPTVEAKETKKGSLFSLPATLSLFSAKRSSS
ncbi:MAG: AAA family ATPase [Bryobacteraceae bacterium]|nr:AAA family ATPase [Bryobacteraceae bacterium]MDW8379598.1 AAA family ATPase [Bryobacterales bacterium]